jgi:DNA-binding Xre family transcriptional regulator
VKLRVKALAQGKGISNPLALAKASGIPYAACHAIWNDQQKQISLGTINRLCAALRVQPGQLFEYEPDSKASVKRKRTIKG